MKFFLLLFLSGWLQVGALELRDQPVSLRVSIVIPCHWSHFPLLENLLDCYSHQSVLPDEVVISLSEVGRVSLSLVDALEQKPWPYTVKLLRHSGAYPPGRNRNEACAQSSGELVICQDADDLPHPQRVEIVKYLFERYQIEHLLHQWLGSGEEFTSRYVLESCPAACSSFRSYDMIDVDKVHNGSVAFLRSLFVQNRWRPMQGISEDVLFNRTAYAFCRHKVVLSLPLICYRGEFSTFDLKALDALIKSIQ